MSRRQVATSATIACRPCGIQSKIVIAPDAEAPKCACGRDFDLSIAGHRRENIFPYTTPHLGDKGGTVVESLHHLRQLERERGFVASAFSQEKSNWDYPMQQAPVARPRR